MVSAPMLEDPTEDALSTDASGQAAYAGTGTEFEQLVLHEIGHALGLADSSDPNSIMAPTLSNANLTLDATDTQAVQNLYGTGSAASSTGSAPSMTNWASLSAQSAQLIDAIAGFTSLDTAALASSLTSQTPLITPIQLAATH